MLMTCLWCGQGAYLVVGLGDTHGRQGQCCQHQQGSLRLHDPAKVCKQRSVKLRMGGDLKETQSAILYKLYICVKSFYMYACKD